MKSLVIDQVVLCHEIIDTPESEVLLFYCSISNHVFTIVHGYGCYVLYESWINNSRFIHTIIMIKNLVRPWFFQRDNKEYFASNNQMAHPDMHLFTS